MDVSVGPYLLQFSAGWQHFTLSHSQIQQINSHVCKGSYTFHSVVYISKLDQSLCSVATVCFRVSLCLLRLTAL